MSLTLNRVDAAAWPMPRFGPWPTGAHDHHVIVVGAGIGGLSAAALIARHGLKVLVLEAHDRPGGYCSCWTRLVRLRDRSIGRFVFDAGVQDVSGLGPDGPLSRLLKETGAEGRIVWHRVRHRYVSDGLSLDVRDTAPEFVARLGALFPHEAAATARLFDEIAKVYGDLRAFAAASGGVASPPDTLAARAAWAGRYPSAARWISEPFTWMLAAFIVDARLRRLLTTVAEYVTDDPERLSVAEMAPLFGYYFEGGFYPGGGSQQFAEVLCRVIEESGGSVQLKTRVARIRIEEGRARGVVTAADDVHRAPLVIANSDVVASLTSLIDPHRLLGRFAARMRTLKRGPSGVLVSLAVEGVPEIPARVFLTADGLSLGIGNPSAIDPSLAPPGHASLSLLWLMPEKEAARWFVEDRTVYRAAKEACAERLIAAAETIIPDLKRRLLYKETGGPPTFTRYALAENGSIYGAARGQWCPPVRTPIPGLLLAGAGCRNGPGIEAVVLTGTEAARLVMASLPEDKI